MKVTARNITELTSLPSFALDVPLAPVMNDLIERLRERLVKMPYPRTAAFVERDLKTLKRAVNAPPNDMVLARVFWEPVPKAQKEKIDREFKRCVARRAFAHYAKKDPKFLRDMGVTKSGLADIKHGEPPRNARGDVLPVGLDHIVSRSKSGLWGYVKEKDADQLDEVAPKFLVNHIGNLMPVFNKTHEFINQVDALQKHIRRGWAVALVRV